MMFIGRLIVMDPAVMRNIMITAGFARKLGVMIIIIASGNTPVEFVIKTYASIAQLDRASAF